MKKLILSLVLTLCMVMVVMPQTVDAAEADWENKIWIGNTPVNRSTNMKDNTWLFFPGYNILQLGDGFSRVSTSNLTGSNDKAVIRIEGLENVTIQLLGTATVGVPSIEFLPPEADDGVQTYGIYAPDTNLAIEGDGTLKVSSNANAIWCKSLRVEGSTLNCNSYRTAIKVVGTGYIDKEENGDMLVKSGATVTAKTLNGSGVYPEEFNLNGGQAFSIGYNYNENGGAAVLVSGDLTVEDSTVTGENTCNKLPSFISGYNESYMGCFYRSMFCSAIFSMGPMKVSGSQASVSGKLKINETYFGNEDYGGCTELGAVMALHMMVEDGGTIEGFITNAGNSKYAQGLKSFTQGSHPVDSVKICLTGEGVFRNGLADKTVTTESPNYIDNGPYDVFEDTNSRDLYPSHRQISISKSSTLYLKKEYYYWWSFQKDFIISNRFDSSAAPVIDLRNFADNTYIDNVKVLSGDWIIIPPCENEVDYCIQSGTLTIQPQDGMEYAGGSAHLQQETTLSIDGDGIAKNWVVSDYNGENSLGGTLRFVSGTVENASASIGIGVYILGGNINFKPISYEQIVRNGDGKQLFRDVYYMNYKNLCQCQDELIEINTGEGIITPESSYYYPIGDSRALVVWTVNDLPIRYVTVAPESGESYKLIAGGAIEGLGNEYHSLKRAEKYWQLKANPNKYHYKAADERVTMKAGLIQTYEYWGGLLDPIILSESGTLPENLRAEWSYVDGDGKTQVVGGNALTCTIDDLSDVVGKRTYTCKVYQKADDNSESEIGSYSATVSVMRWEPKTVFYAALGKEVTFTANPSEEVGWASQLNTVKWQVNKGAGWEDIPDSATDSYTVTITAENAGYKYRRVVKFYVILALGSMDGESYKEFTSPELSVTLVPEITSQPQDLTIHEKDTTEHLLSVTAENAESYQWQRKADGVFADIKGQTSSTLKVGPQDVGTYRCVVSNKYGETVSEEASVTMRPAPICDTPTGGHAALGATAQLNASFSNVSGDGSVHIKWQYSTDDGATWVDVVSTDPSDNISMFYIAIEFGYKPIDPPGAATIISSRIDGATMTINKTTADMDGWKVRCVLTDAFGVYYSNTVELSIDMPDYTVTFDTDGGTEIASKTSVKWKDKVLDGITAPTKDGWKFIGWQYGDVTVTPQTTYKELAVEDTVLSIELKAQWEDIEGPTGEISIGENSWKAFLNNITFGLFFKDTQTVTITASDNSGETVTVEYLLSDKALTETELDGKIFTAYTAPFDIYPDNEYIVYVRLTDTAGNVSYICSDGIVLDGTSPVISGIENGKTYCESQTVTITEKYVDTVTVNGTAVTLDENGSFVLTPADGEQTIVVTDKAGNTAEMTVTVNDGHTLGTATCEDKAKCEICGEAYGELDPNNHADLTHIPEKPATNDTEGNIEYWYCEVCDKYYSDATATKEIAKDDTVTAKLKDDSKSPQTGDTSNLALWIVLLFVSGGAVIGTTVVSRKKKYKR